MTVTGTSSMQVGDQVELAEVPGVLDHAVDDRLDPRPQALDGARRERLRHEPAQPGVVGRLHVDQLEVEQVPERRLVRPAAGSGPIPRGSRRGGTSGPAAGRGAGR